VAPSNLERMKMNTTYFCPTCQRDVYYGHECMPLESMEAYSYTKDEMVVYAKNFLEEVYGPLKDSQDKDAWLSRLGLLYNFISGPFPK
jgi:glucan phosphoethanolaminetransferase (alkaline phosphatase superfamily)